MRWSLVVVPFLVVVLFPYEVEVQHSVRVNAPAADVFAVLRDPTHEPFLQPLIVDVEMHLDASGTYVSHDIVENFAIELPLLGTRHINNTVNVVIATVSDSLPYRISNSVTALGLQRFLFSMEQVFVISEARVVDGQVVTNVSDNIVLSCPYLLCQHVVAPLAAAAHKEMLHNLKTQLEA